MWIIVAAPIIPFGIIELAVDSASAESRKKEGDYHIPVKDETGKAQVLKVHESIADQVHVNEGDTVHLQESENGILLIVNGKPRHYAIPLTKVHLLQQEPL